MASHRSEPGQRSRGDLEDWELMLVGLAEWGRRVSFKTVGRVSAWVATRTNPEFREMAAQLEASRGALLGTRWILEDERRERERERQIDSDARHLWRNEAFTWRLKCELEEEKVVKSNKRVRGLQKLLRIKLLDKNSNKNKE